MYTIESGIQIPADVGRKGAQRLYPFADMRVGDSVFFATATTDGREVRAARSFFRRAGWSLVARRVGSGMRVWRTA